MIVAMAVFAVAGPLRPGWSHRAGTSAALLDQLARERSVASSAVSTGSARAGTVPPVPFTYLLTGSKTASTPDAEGRVQYTLSTRLQDPSSTPLSVVLEGTRAGSGGIAMASGTVAFGPYHGTVTSLDGDTVVAAVSAPEPETLTLTLQVDSSGALSGTATGAGR